MDLAIVNTQYYFSQAPTLPNEKALHGRQRDGDLIFIHDLQIEKATDGTTDNLKIRKIRVETRYGIYTTLQSIWSDNDTHMDRDKLCSLNYKRYTTLVHLYTLIPTT